MRSFQQTSGRLVTVCQQSVKFKALSKSSLVQSLVNRITSRSANTLTGIKLVRTIINFTFNHTRSTNCCFVSKHFSHHLGHANTFDFSIICKCTDECLFENKLPTQDYAERKSLSTTRYVETRVIFPQLLVQLILEQRCSSQWTSVELRNSCLLSDSVSFLSKG